MLRPLLFGTCAYCCRLRALLDAIPDRYKGRRAIAAMPSLLLLHSPQSSVPRQISTRAPARSKPVLLVVVGDVGLVADLLDDPPPRLIPVRVQNALHAAGLQLNLPWKELNEHRQAKFGFPTSTEVQFVHGAVYEH